MQRAYDAADEKFKEQYRALLMEFVESGKNFTGEDVQMAYKAQEYELPREWRAVGSIYSSLRRRGVIEIVGYETRCQGSPTAVYRKKRGKDSRP